MRGSALVNARFRNRHEAGRRLAEHLAAYANRSDVIVLALPRGGVPIGFEVARALDAPLDLFVVRKVGLPWHEEMAMGAVASGGALVLDQELIQHFGLSADQVAAAVNRERRELERRERLYRGGRPFPHLDAQTAILVDDGLATGASMRVAVHALREERPASIVVAVPVAPPETCAALREVADEVVCAVTPEPFRAVGVWYEDFTQTSDEEVHTLLEEDARHARIR